MPQGGCGPERRRRSTSGAMATRPDHSLYVSECVEGTIRLMRSRFEGPVNIGSDEMVTINQLADMIMAIAGSDWRSDTSRDRSACAAATPTIG